MQKSNRRNVMEENNKELEKDLEKKAEDKISTDNDDVVMVVDDFKEFMKKTPKKTENTTNLKTDSNSDSKSDEGTTAEDKKGSEKKVDGGEITGLLPFKPQRFKCYRPSICETWCCCLFVYF